MTENSRRTWPTKSIEQGSYGLPKTVTASTGFLGSVSGPLCICYDCYLDVIVELLIRKDISNPFACFWDSFLPLGCFIQLCYGGSCLCLILSCFFLFGWCLLDVCSFLKGNWGGVDLRGEMGKEMAEAEGQKTVGYMNSIREESIFNKSK